MTARDVIAGLVAEWRAPTPQDECTLYTMGMRAGRHACADRLESTLAQPASVPNDDELPGMWERADFTGGDPDERSYAERQRTQPSGEAVGFIPQWAADQLRNNGYVRCTIYSTIKNGVFGDGKPAVPLYTTPPAPLGGLTEGEREALERVEEWAADEPFAVGSVEADTRLIVAALRRLTTPHAEGVELTTKWDSATGMHLPTPEACAAIAALTAAAPKVAADALAAHLASQQEPLGQDFERVIATNLDAMLEPAAAPQAEAGEDADPENWGALDKRHWPRGNPDHGEIGWLIERGDAPNGPAQWWRGNDTNPCDAGWPWTTDAAEAIRFSRRVDAENGIKAFNLAACHKATEHSWLRCLAQPAAQGGDGVLALAAQLRSRRFHIPDPSNIFSLADWIAGELEKVAALAPQRSERGE